MFKNYLTTALRVLVKNKLYSAINIFGLAVGIAACLLILMFVLDEFSYDNFWPSADRIYRVQTSYYLPGRAPLISIRNPGATKNWIDKDLVGAEAVARMRDLEAVIEQDGEVRAEQISFIDPEFLDIFQVTVLAGEFTSSRGDASSLIITESFARKYFGDGSAVGQVLTLSVYELVRDYKVVAVIADVPPNSHFKWQAFAFVNEPDFKNQPWEFVNWSGLNNLTYIKMQPGSTSDMIARQMPGIIDDNQPPTFVGGQKIRSSGFMRFRAVNLKDIQLHGGGDWGTKPAGDINLVYALSAIGIMILLIAGINFVNLTTARSTRRAREVSLRKVAGARRGQLIVQYVSESVLLSLLGLFLALGIVLLILPWFNGFTGKAMSLFGGASAISAGLGLALLLGFVGGIYPAFYISRFQPAGVLRANKSAETAGSGRLRAALVVVQFGISIGLAICTAVIYGQTIYARTIDLGFQKENKIIVRDLWNYKVFPHVETLLREVKRLPGVISVGRSSWAPGAGSPGFLPIERPGTDLGDLAAVAGVNVDEDFLETYGIGPIIGRAFDPDFPTDAMPVNVEALPESARVASAIISEASLSLLRFNSPLDAIGQELRISVAQPAVGPPFVTLKVIGVTPDVHFSSLREEIAPTMYVLETRPDHTSRMTIRYSPNAAPDMPAALERVWKGVIPDSPIKYEFLDESWDAQYDGDERQAATLSLFAGLAIIIACLGLFGLSSFTAELRTKEIGIRKVMGARTRNIMQLLLSEFSKPILLANFIAWPAAWYAMSEWLTQFHYRIDLTAGYFLIAALGALVIAWVTVGLHVVRVAQAIPITALRYE